MPRASNAKPRALKAKPRLRARSDFAAITITVVVERARLDEATRAATDAAANVEGAILAHASPTARPLTRDEWHTTDEGAHRDARMAHGSIHG
jgi:hypothetical protein